MLADWKEFLGHPDGEFAPLQQKQQRLFFPPPLANRSPANPLNRRLACPSSNLINTTPCYDSSLCPPSLSSESTRQSFLQITIEITMPASENEKTPPRTPPSRISINGDDVEGHDTPKSARSSSGWDGKLRIEKKLELANPEALSDPEYSDEENVVPGESIDADEGMNPLPSPLSYTHLDPILTSFCGIQIYSMITL
jgi:hypothetical protein